MGWPYYQVKVCIHSASSHQHTHTHTHTTHTGLTFLDASISQVVDGGQQRPQAHGLAGGDAQDLQTVLDQVPDIGLTVHSLSL